MKYILNVTTKCPNYHEEDKEFEYKRIAVTDTGTQKLSQHFREAFEFIGEHLREGGREGGIGGREGGREGVGKACIASSSYISICISVVKILRVYILGKTNE